jgi:hypothetical protein
VIAGKKDRLLGKLQKYGITKEEAEKQIQSWSAGVSGTSAKSMGERKAS